VQGDVGSGKTVIAFAAIYLMFKKGSQSALMAPTEILAKQHFKTCEKFLKPMGINVQLLTGSTPESDRRAILQQTKTGTCDLLVGTHAFIQDDVEFSKLELVVIDEQHRFGVKQREQFRKHGFPHVLSLSATPIPRTMALTLYGDQDLSILDELPPGRKEIVTRIVPEAKRDDASFWINDQIRKGRQIFVICPLIETSEVLEVKAATEEFKRLNEDVFPEHRSALLHGRMKSNEKEAIMNAFSKGEVDILVSTAVVEVGIDVPNASIMMIEGADRFGLAQLHQFRGRVGRGEHQSYCFLFTDSQSQDALLRLKYMVKYNSGFDLAEMDLALRGPGEVYGVKQSGLPDLKIATYTDVDLLKRVRSRADDLLKEDVMLSRYPLLRQKVEYVDEGSIGF
ncbi:MAG: ATP-dependent DNA helicase RecG, partial [Patescibacteria group bacterium]